MARTQPDYYPGGLYHVIGWWDGSAQISIYINSKKWAELPLEYQAILEMACADAHVEMMAANDAKNAVALKQFRDGQFQWFRVAELAFQNYAFTKIGTR